MSGRKIICHFTNCDELEIELILLILYFRYYFINSETIETELIITHMIVLHI